DMPDAEVFYVPDFVDKVIVQEWYNELLMLDSCKITPFMLMLKYTPKLKVYGWEVMQSRKIASMWND
ncbi:hypothetical protein L208DRAFT_1061048, partial [Tricholoma matsutake]